MCNILPPFYGKDQLRIGLRDNKHTQTTKFRDSSPISMREAMSAPQSLTLLAGQLVVVVAKFGLTCKF